MVKTSNDFTKCTHVQHADVVLLSDFYLWLLQKLCNLGMHMEKVNTHS